MHVRKTAHEELKSNGCKHKTHQTRDNSNAGVT
jgi:hypothetical protein